MKKYKRLKMFRTYGPIIVGLTIGIFRDLLLGIIVAVLWILIDLIFIEPKLPFGKKRQEGEIFVIEPVKNKFFFAKMIRTKIPIDDPVMNGGHLVYVFNMTDNPMVIPEYLDPHNLAIPPQIIDNDGWKHGKFQSVGFKRVTTEERDLKYGFWDIKTEKFVNEEGKELSEHPNTYSDFGLSSYGSIVDDLIEECKLAE